VWIVIASEALLFAGLFALYASYRHEYTTAFEAGVLARMQAKLIAPIAPSRKCQNCFLTGFPPLVMADVRRPISGELPWCRFSIAGSLADNDRMTANQTTRKLFFNENSSGRPSSRGSAYWFSPAACSFP